MLSEESKSALHRYENDLMTAEGQLSDLSLKEKGLEQEARRLHTVMERAKKEMEILEGTKARLHQDQLTLQEDIRLLKQKMKALI